MKKIRKNSQKIPKIKPFVNKYNWKRIYYPSREYDLKKFENIIEQLLLMCYMLKR